MSIGVAIFLKILALLFFIMLVIDGIILISRGRK